MRVVSLPRLREEISVLYLTLVSDDAVNDAVVAPDAYVGVIIHLPHVDARVEVGMAAALGEERHFEDVREQEEHAGVHASA
jgi:hypothetical protein